MSSSILEFLFFFNLVGKVGKSGKYFFSIFMKRKEISRKGKIRCRKKVGTAEKLVENRFPGKKFKRISYQTDNTYLGFFYLLIIEKHKMVDSCFSFLLNQ